jgi:cytochrome c551
MEGSVLKRSFALIVATLISMVALLGACGQAGNDASGASDSSAPTLVDSAGPPVDALFKKNCVICHGNNLEGRAGPQTNLQKIGATWSKEQIVGQITNGGKAMPSFKSRLSESDINAIADWLVSRK